MRKTHFKPNQPAFVLAVTFTHCLRTITPKTLVTNNPTEVTCKRCKKTKLNVWNPESRTHQPINPFNKPLSPEF